MSYTLEELDTRRGAVRLERYSAKDFRVQIFAPLAGRWAKVGDLFKTLPPARSEFRKEARRMTRKV
jgi:hypothetical protein